VRSWETREVNTLEEPGSAKRRVLQVAKLISKTVFSISANPTPSCLLSMAYKLAEDRRETPLDVVVIQLQQSHPVLLAV
jgi:hypothetical protein